MLDVDQIVEVKQLAGRGVPIREIARRLAVSRNAVRRYLRGAAPGVYQQRRPRPQVVRDSIRERVRELLATERAKETPRKQRLSAARIHRLLLESKMRVSVRTVSTLVAVLRRELSDPLATTFLPLQYDPGHDAQVDFMEAEVDDVRDGRVKRHVLIVRLCCSRYAFRYAAPNQTREAVLEGLMLAFDWFGGVPRNLWFDNLTPIVRRVLKGRDRELQRGFSAFEAHYGFRGQFCAPGKGNEKGGVEHDVRFTRHEVFSPIPTVDGRAGLQQHLDAHSRRELDRTVRGCEHSIGVLWERERPCLLPLPPTRFEAATTRAMHVSRTSWVQTGTNFYSVPVHLAGSRVTVKLGAEQIVVLDGNAEVARHPRSYGHGRMVLDLMHYLPLLERKHRGLDRCVPMRQWLERVPPCWPRLLAELRTRQGEIDGSRAFIEVLRLCGSHSLDSVTAAVEQTLASPHVGLPIVRYHLGVGEQAGKDVTATIDYQGPPVQQGPIAAYMEVASV